MSQLLFSYVFLIIYNGVFFVFVTSVPYVARSMQMDELNLAYSQTFFNIAALLSTTFMGSLIKALDYKLTFALCFGSVGMASTILLNATNPWIILTAQSFGFFMSAQQGVQIAVAHLTSAGSERTNAFSRLGMCFGLGFMLTPIISKLATTFGDERSPLKVGAALSFATLPLVLLFIENLQTKEVPKKPDETDIKDSKASKSMSGLELLRKDADLRLLFILKVLLLSPAFVVFGSMQIYLMNTFQVTQTTNTLIQLDVGISLMFSNSIGMTFLRRKYKEHQLIWIGAFVCLFCYAQFCFFLYLFQIWFMLFFLIFGITIAGNSADSLISTSANHEQQGIVLGLSNSAISIARTSAPTFGMWMSKTFGFGSLGLSGIVAACVAILFLYSNKSFNRPQEKESLKTD